ncbi:MAG: M23 family metallopeptidase [Actinobacteria bacterium]|nr:M23 family metallopeptidase [Actinomycetota bacterium]
MAVRTTKFRLPQVFLRGGSSTLFAAIATFFTAIATLIAFAAPASAADGAAGQNGATYMVITPKIAKIECRRACARKRSIRAGSLLRVTGENLSAVGQVVFLGSTGDADDTIATVIKTGGKSLLLHVPPDASTGPLVAIGANGARSKPSAPVAVRPAPPVIGTPDLTPLAGFQGPAGVTLDTGTSTPRVVFFGAKQLVRFSLRLGGASASAIVTLIRPGTGEIIASWNVAVPDGQVVSVDWNGMAGALPATAGRYAFRVAMDFGTAPTQDAAGAPTTAAATPAASFSLSPSDTRDAFDLYGYVFPVRGKHNFGQFAASFGGGRGHQGQDILAACNAKLVAARGGTVIESRSHSAAGNFIVIRPDFGGGDNAYMHLISPSPFKPGDHVYTGQTIGNVGQTGHASACHLHFEQWTGEIWRTRPVDPLPELLAWDQVS